MNKIIFFILLIPVHRVNTLFTRNKYLQSFHFIKFLVWFKDVNSDIWTHKLDSDLDPFEFCYLMVLFSLEADYLDSLWRIKVSYLSVIFYLKPFWFVLFAMTIYGFFSVSKMSLNWQDSSEITASGSEVVLAIFSNVLDWIPKALIIWKDPFYLSIFHFPHILFSKNYTVKCLVANFIGEVKHKRPNPPLWEVSF